jgi:hypothetical protein
MAGTSSDVEMHGSMPKNVQEIRAQGYQIPCTLEVIKAKGNVQSDRLPIDNASGLRESRQDKKE